MDFLYEAIGFVFCQKNAFHFITLRWAFLSSDGNMEFIGQNINYVFRDYTQAMFDGYFFFM